ncbi:redoxin domain-containing protein [Ornithinibacillus halophilus]|uniref:Peroxiredoxin n=1 Tax=Ornithinibacillus halophilus TaxID=930117 RepID=A0A1M5NUQ0_9BACI|nr:redoxin domain-containing protein [Ornithinibacillus halophilus]SHG93304.1 Peroxiredoxin [Ornithinibacillus halophilus]
MKKGILLIVITIMLGYAVWDFMDSDKNNNTSDATLEEDASNGSIDETGENDPDIVIGLEKGNRAPDFELQTLDGDLVKLSDFRGSRVMVNFWATWCPPCRAEMPDMEEFYQNKDVVILAVNLAETETSVDDIHTFVDDFNLSFPILLDEVTEVATMYKIQPIPTTFMVDSEGIIQYKAFGAMNYDLMVQEFEKMK